jgi:hypothetical protein
LGLGLATLSVVTETSMIAKIAVCRDNGCIVVSHKPVGARTRIAAVR